MVDRIRQFLNYIYGAYDATDDRLAREVLTKKEYDIFIEMDDYDKIHSIEVLKMVLVDELLSSKDVYYKLALLHDCGKGEVGLIRRMKKVLLGDKQLEKHPKRSYEMLRDINLEVAKLALEHHNSDVSEDLKRFQYIDKHC